VPGPSPILFEGVMFEIMPVLDSLEDV
jgi:hypothetical protein